MMSTCSKQADKLSPRSRVSAEHKIPSTVKPAVSTSLSHILVRSPLHCYYFWQLVKPRSYDNAVTVGEIVPS